MTYERSAGIGAREVGVLVADLVLGVTVSAVTSSIVCRLLISAGLVDVPHMARHQHKKPTPTSGGLGIAAGYALGVMAIVAWAVATWSNWLSPDEAERLAVATAFSFLFLVIGFIDDTFPLGPRGKFLAFATASATAAWSVGVVHVFPVGDGSFDVGFVIGLVGSALWVFTLINCVNFMDGANGLAMGSVAIGLAGLLLVMDADLASGAAMMALCGAGALAGFLIWNYPNGKLFAGDSGALFAGALASLASLLAIVYGGVSPFVPPLLFFPMLADALLTLAWRASRKHNLLNGHADHIYQVAIRAGFSHGRISLCYWLAAAACAIAAYVGERLGGAWPVIALGAMAVAAVLISATIRRWALSRGIAEVQ